MKQKYVCGKNHKEAGQFVVLFACCCCSVAESCLILVNPMDCSMPGLPVLHPLPEFAQTHVHWLGDAIQPSHPLLSTSPPAFNLSQHQGIFQWVGSSHQMAKVLKLQLQHQSFSWINIQGWFPLGLTGWISHLSKELPRVFSSTTVCKPQFSGAQPSLWSNSHIYIWLLVKPLLWLYKPLSAKWWFAFQYAV